MATFFSPVGLMLAPIPPVRVSSSPPSCTFKSTLAAISVSVSVADTDWLRSMLTLLSSSMGVPSSSSSRAVAEM